MDLLLSIIVFAVLIAVLLVFEWWIQQIEDEDSEFER